MKGGEPKRLKKKMERERLESMTDEQLLEVARKQKVPVPKDGVSLIEDLMTQFEKRSALEAVA